MLLIEKNTMLPKFIYLVAETVTHFIRKGEYMQVEHS